MPKFTIGTGIFPVQNPLYLKGKTKEWWETDACYINVDERSCVTPAYMNELETTALAEKQQDKVKVCAIQSGKNTRVS